MVWSREVMIWPVYLVEDFPISIPHVQSQTQNNDISDTPQAPAERNASSSNPSRKIPHATFSIPLQIDA
jgi:hypothetical protein